MPRRQPYQQSVPAGAPPAQDKDQTLETEEGGLQITLADEDFAPVQEQQTSAPPETKAPPPEPRELAKTADDEAFTRLKAQLERSEQQRQDAQTRLSEAEKQRSAYEDSLKVERERTGQIQQQHWAAQELAIDNAIRVAEREAASAKDMVQRALEAADYAAAAEAQSNLAQAHNDLSRLREGKTAIGQQKTAPAQQERTEQPPVSKETQREPQSDWERIEAYITQPAHPPRVQTYMRDHYDDLFANNGTRVNKLVAAHWDAKSQGLPEFSDDYFKHVDRYMGYTKAEQPPAPPAAAAPSPPQEQEPPKQKTAIPPPAPVSRGAGTNAVSGTSITLTPAQVQFCREAGIDPKVYARQMLALNRAKNDPTYDGPRWSSERGI